MSHWLETTLGWVASGVLWYSSRRRTRGRCTIVGKCNSLTDQLDRNLKRMWDLESMGVVESKEMHDKFVDNIEFTGSRYSGKLPWRVGN